MGAGAAARLLWADYRALYARKRPGQREPVAKAAALAVPRTAIDANLQALALVRALGAAPPGLRGAIQRTLMFAHGMYVDPSVSIGPGLFLPHPIAITLGPGTTLGADVSIFHNVSLSGAPRIGSSVRLSPGVTITGPLTVGAGASLGAGVVATDDIPPDARISRPRTEADGVAAPASEDGTAAGGWAEPLSFAGLLRADHAARFGPTAMPGAWRLAWDAVRDRPFRVVAIVRLRDAAPPQLWRLWRRVLLVHGCEIGHDARIGPGLSVPFPIGVVVGRRSVLGANVELLEHTTVTPTKMVWHEADAGRGLRVGDGVRLLPGAGAYGDDLAIGAGATLAPHAVITRDVPAAPPRAAAPQMPAPQRLPPPPPLLDLLRSDLARLGPGALFGLPFQAAVLVRLATSRRRRLARLGHAAAAAFHHCDVDQHVRIGPGLHLPLPCGIRLEAGTDIGARVTLHDRVSLRGAPRIPAGTTVISGTVTMGGAFSTPSPLGHGTAAQPH
jgi:serine O-acetyltransferase